jgi:hypothetical protein
MRTFLVCVILVFPLGAARGQARGEPNLILTAYAGAANGHALWSTARQPVIHASQGGSLMARDTVALDRRVNAAIVAGASVSLFRTGRVGFSLDVAYRDFSFDDTCTPIFLQADDTTATNRRLCDNITASANGGSVISVTLGAIVRGATGGAVSPYVRGALAFANTTISTIAMAAPDALGGAPRVLVDDPQPRRTSFNPLIAIGLTTSLGVGYQLRIEARDEFARLERMDGSVNGVGIGPLAVEGFHHFALVLGLDVVLEQKRVRRY